jgi:DNA-binding transcriptional MerR regulator
MREQVPDDLLRIGEFSKVSHVPAKTLRYYDRIGLLEPAYVDPVTNYRYYSLDQLPRINQILTLKDLGLSLDQIGRLLEDALPLPELRGMLRLKKIEIEEQLDRENERLARVEARLRQIEEEQVKVRREGVGAMRTCSHCGRRVRGREGNFCPYCGGPLTSPHAGFLPIDKSVKDLTVRSLGLLLVALALVAVVAGLVTVVADGRGAPDLIARPLSPSPAANPQLALSSLQYQRSQEPKDLVFEGRVKNISDVPLVDVMVIISLYDADPELITTGRAPVARHVLEPGETSAFSVEVDASPLAYYYGAIFQRPSGETIPVRDDRSE